MEISSKDPDANSFVEWLDNQPDITEDDVEEQVIESNNTRSSKEPSIDPEC
ncbi:MAG: hypothetical protein KY428_08370 [Bacteroidetes bacterium]|nr:hypothetical protein [Bacteroidota bacterium]